jgi:hypothetical protein
LYWHELGSTAQAIVVFHQPEPKQQSIFPTVTLFCHWGQQTTQNVPPHGVHGRLPPVVLSQQLKFRTRQHWASSGPADVPDGKTPSNAIARMAAYKRGS